MVRVRTTRTRMREGILRVWDWSAIFFGFAWENMREKYNREIRSKGA